MEKNSPIDEKRIKRALDIQSTLKTDGWKHILEMVEARKNDLLTSSRENTLAKYDNYKIVQDFIDEVNDVLNDLIN